MKFGDAIGLVAHCLYMVGRVIVLMAFYSLKWMATAVWYAWLIVWRCWCMLCLMCGLFIAICKFLEKGTRDDSKF